MKTQEEFFQAHQVDGQLSPEHTAQMLNLPEGDTTALPVEGSEPAAAASSQPADTTVVEPKKEPETPAEPAKTTEAVEDPTKTVILAKDGVHTIDYQKLVDAREAERVAKAQAQAAEAEAERLRTELEAAKQPPKEPQATEPAKPDPSAAVDFGDYSDEALRKGISETVARAVAQATEPLKAKLAELEPLQAKQALTEAEKHWTTILTAHPDNDSIVESKELADWIASKPTFAQPGYQRVLTDGTAEQVVEMFDAFKKETGTTAAPAATDAEKEAQAKAAQAAAATAAAEKAIASAKTTPPSSLTEIAGTSAHVDEPAAMLEMSPMAALNKFIGKSPEQIEQLLSRAL